MVDFNISVDDFNKLIFMPDVTGESKMYLMQSKHNKIWAKDLRCYWMKHVCIYLLVNSLIFPQGSKFWAISRGRSSMRRPSTQAKRLSMARSLDDLEVRGILP